MNKWTTFQKTKRKAAKQRSIALQRKRTLLLHSEQLLFKRIVLLPFLVHLFYILWPKTSLIWLDPNVMLEAPFIHPKPVWPSFSCPPPKKSSFSLSPLVSFKGLPAWLHVCGVCVRVCVAGGVWSQLIGLPAKGYTVRNTRPKTYDLSIKPPVGLKNGSEKFVVNSYNGSQWWPTDWYFYQSMQKYA